MKQIARKTGFSVVLLIVVFIVLPQNGLAGKIKAELVKLDTRDGVTQSFVVLAPENPTASLIVFSGGWGDIQVAGKANKPKIKKDGSFLVHVRKQFAEQGFIVASIDSPSDKKSPGTSGHKNMPGMGMDWRLSAEHMQDVRAVVNYLKERNLPVYLAGQSLGSMSVVTAGINMNDQINGIIMTSAATKAKPPWKEKWPVFANYPNAILDFPDLDKVTVPVLVVAHKDDSCVPTPAERAPKLVKSFVNSKSAELQIYEGGYAKADGCHYRGAHSYYGQEKKVVAGIADFIRKHSPKTTVQK